MYICIYVYIYIYICLRRIVGITNVQFNLVVTLSCDQVLNSSCKFLNLKSKINYQNLTRQTLSKNTILSN